MAAEGAFVAERAAACSSASSVYAGGGGSSSLVSLTSCQEPVSAGAAAPIGAEAKVLDTCSWTFAWFGTYVEAEPLLPLEEVAGPRFRLPQ